mgnify:CR=1 FL=1
MTSHTFTLSDENPKSNDLLFDLSKSEKHFTITSSEKLTSPLKLSFKNPATGDIEYEYLKQTDFGRKFEIKHYTLVILEKQNNPFPKPVSFTIHASLIMW